MDEEERRYYYQRAENDYYEAKHSRDHAEEKWETSYLQKCNAESELNTFENEKINLEKRLEQIIKSISAFGSLDSIQISNANRAALKASKEYGNAIKPKNGAAAIADIGSHFETKDINSDNNSSSALSSCRAEKNRLENAIDIIESSIRNLNTRISSLESNIQTYKAQYDAYDRAMGTYRNLMNEYS